MLSLVDFQKRQKVKIIPFSLKKSHHRIKSLYSCMQTFLTTMVTNTSICSYQCQHETCALLAISWVAARSFGKTGLSSYASKVWSHRQFTDVESKVAFGNVLYIVGPMTRVNLSYFPRFCFICCISFLQECRPPYSIELV